MRHHRVAGRDRGPHVYPRPGTPPQLGACQNNLRQLNAAKAQWAFENLKGATEVPGDTDLFGATLYIVEKPACPALGTYTLNEVDTLVSCSVAYHTLEYQLWPVKPAPRSRVPSPRRRRGGPFPPLRRSPAAGLGFTLARAVFVSPARRLNIRLDIPLRDPLTLGACLGEGIVLRS